MELLADKELIDNVKKLVNNNQSTENVEENVQSGGFVFNLIFYMTKIFGAVLKFLKKILISLYPILFRFKLFKLGKRPVKNEDGSVKTDDAGQVEYENVPLFRPHIKPGEGNLWKYLKICIKVSFYLCIFALGGIFVTVFGMIYLYSKLGKHFGKLGKKDDTQNNNNNTEE